VVARRLGLGPWSRANPWQFSAVLVLQPQELAGEALEFPLGSHAFGDVTASAATRTGFPSSSMKSLPALLENFDPAIRHNDPIFDRARRALVQGRYKRCIHFRAVLRLNEFAELWTGGWKPDGSVSKDAVCLL